MGIVKDFYDELASFVNVEITVGGYDGVDLTPGEEFDLNIRISNSSDLPFLSDHFTVRIADIAAQEISNQCFGHDNR